MQLIRNFQYGVQKTVQNHITNKNKLSNLTSSIKFEKIMFGFNAIFEGVGMAGIISAAFWYATAPMAPDGFKGPIATFTIAISTIASLMFAIPIAYSAYKKFNHNLENYNTDFQIEIKHFDNNLEELYFELLKFRTLFNSDYEYYAEIKLLMKFQIVKLVAFNVCKIFSIYKNRYFALKWDSTSKLTIYENNNVVHSMKFIDLLKQNSLTNLKTFRKEIVKSTFRFIINNQFQRQQFSTKHFKKF